MGHSVKIHIQPVYNSQDYSIEYVEALIREYRGLTNVCEIIRFVERNSIEKLFDLEVLNEVIKNLKDNPNLKYPIGVNLCRKTLGIKGFANEIIKKLDENSISHDSVIIEINENTNFFDRTIVENMSILKNSGIRTALDDFGVGSTNLMSIIDHDFDYIKMDKKLIDMDDKWDNKRLVLSHMKKVFTKMGVDAIVEGIETEEQLKEVTSLGYEWVQGFIYARPLPISKFLSTQVIN